MEKALSLYLTEKSAGSYIYYLKALSIKDWDIFCEQWINGKEPEYASQRDSMIDLLTTQSTDALSQHNRLFLEQSGQDTQSNSGTLGQKVVHGNQIKQQRKAKLSILRILGFVLIGYAYVGVLLYCASIFGLADLDFPRLAALLIGVFVSGFLLLGCAETYAIILFVSASMGAIAYVSDLSNMLVALVPAIFPIPVRIQHLSKSNREQIYIGTFACVFLAVCSFAIIIGSDYVPRLLLRARHQTKEAARISKELETVAAYKVGWLESRNAKSAIKEYMEASAHDPDSIEYVSFDPMLKEHDGSIKTLARIRARNRFGALQLEEYITYVSDSDVIFTLKVEPCYDAILRINNSDASWEIMTLMANVIMCEAEDQALESELDNLGGSINQTSNDVFFSITERKMKIGGLKYKLLVSLARCLGISESEIRDDKERAIEEFLSNLPLTQ